MANENNAAPLDLLLHRLNQVEQRGILRLKLLTLLTLLALFGLAYLGFSALDINLKLAKPFRLLATGMVSVALGAVLVLFIIRTIRAHIGAKKAALEVEARFRELESAVSTSVEFGTDREKTLRLSSPEVVEALIAHTHQRTQRADFLRAIDWRTPRRVGLAVLFVGLICLAYFVMFPRLARLTFLRFVAPWATLPAPTLTWAEIRPGTRDVRRLETVEVIADVTGRLPKTATIHFAIIPEDAPPETALQWRHEKMTKSDSSPGHRLFTFSFPRVLDSVCYYVTVGDFVSDKYFLNVYEVPKITQLKMTLTYPEYTGMKPKVVEDAVGPITALRGTEVQITGLVNKTVANAAVQFDAETEPPVPAREIKGNQFTVAFTLGNNTKYRLLVTDLQGRTNDDAAFYTIKCVEDNPPDIKLTKPAKNLTMIKTAEVPLEIQASDDYGLSEVGVAYKIKEDLWKRLPLTNLKPNTKQAEKLTTTLFLEEMDLADTDVVTYYAYARDNDTISGPKENTSDLYFIEIEPFGQQYKLKDEDAATKMPGADSGQKMVMKLEDIIKKQKEVITHTFRIDKEYILKKKFTEERVAQVKDLGSQENTLRKQTDDLSKNLQEQLLALGLVEDLDRVENLDRAAVRMGLASLALDALDTSTALPYENDALYHLYRAKRDILNLITKHAGNKELAKQLRQALDMAAKNQQKDEQQQRQEEIEKLQQKAEELAQMAQEQKDINKQLHEQAAQQAQAQSQSGKEQPSQQQMQQREELAKREEELAKRAEETARELRLMDFNNPNQSYQAASDTAKAAGEMKDAQKAIREQKMADARDHGVKAEKNIAKAQKAVQRALERSVTEQLRDAANQARELADNQRQLANETEQLAQATRPSQPQQAPLQQGGRQQAQAPPQIQQDVRQQTAQPQTQHPGQMPQDQHAQTPQQAATLPQPHKGQTSQTQQASPQQGERQRAVQKQSAQDQLADAARQLAEQGHLQADQRQPDISQQAEQAREAEQKRRDLAERQAELRKDADRLGDTLADLAPRLKEVDPEIATGVEKEAETMRSGRAQKPMEQAQKALEKKDLTRARAEQRNAQRPLDETAKNLRDLAEQLTMDESARIAKAIEKAKELAAKQDALNRRLEQMARPPKPEAEVPQKQNETAQQPQQAEQRQKPQPDTEQLAQNQREIREDTNALAKQVERLKSLEKSNLDQQIKESLAKASANMVHSEANIRENNLHASAAHGQEASTELKHTMKAMRRALNESLNERLAEAVEQAQKTAQAQQSAKETLEKATKDKKRGEPIPPDKEDRAVRDQAEATENLHQLQRNLQALAKQSRAAGEQPIAENVEKVNQELDQAKTPQRMAQAQKEIKDRNWPAAQQHQQAATSATAAAYEQLRDLYQDQTALPMQKMKNAVESTKQLAEDVKRLQKKVAELEALKTKGDEANRGELGKTPDLQKLALEQKEAEKKAEALAARLNRLDPNAQDLKQSAEELTTQMKLATQKLAKGQTKDVMPGLNKASKALQSIGDGLIQRLNRLADKEKRRDPDEEKAPPEYRKLVEQYTRALSED